MDEDEVFMTELVVIYVDDNLLTDYFACEGAVAMAHAAQLAAEGKRVVVKREMHNCYPDELAAAEARCAQQHPAEAARKATMRGERSPHARRMDYWNN